MSGEKKQFIDRGAILSASDVEYKEVNVPEWGGTVRLRSLSALESQTFAENFKKGDKDGQVRLIIMSAVDEHGDPLFTEADIAALQKKSMKVVLRLQNAAMELNGLRDAKVAVEEAKNV